jgi:hypothetical protein
VLLDNLVHNLTLGELLLVDAVADEHLALVGLVARTTGTSVRSPVPASARQSPTAISNTPSSAGSSVLSSTRGTTLSPAGDAGSGQAEGSPRRGW